MNREFIHKKLTIIALFLISSFLYNTCQAQEKPKPGRDEISIPVYIHGLKDKNDVEKVQAVLKKQSWTKFVQVEGSPQMHTHIIIKNNITPEEFNNVIKPEGYYILNKSFLDNRETERALVESHKMVNYKPHDKVK